MSYQIVVHTQGFETDRHDMPTLLQAVISLQNWFSDLACEGYVVVYKPYLCEWLIGHPKASFQMRVTLEDVIKPKG